MARVITRLNVGGPAIQAALLHERLDRRRFDQRIYAGASEGSEGDIGDVGRVRRVSPIRVPGLRRSLSPVAELTALAFLVKEFSSFRPAIVHTHMSKAGLHGRLAASLTRRPVIIHTFHGTVFSGYFGGAASRGVLLAERALARVCRRVISISPQQTRELLRLGVAPSGKIVEIPLGLELSPFLQSAPGSLRGEIGIRPEVPLVGIVARLVPIKRVDLFLRSAAQLTLMEPRSRFVVVGDGSERARLEALAEELGLRDSCSFLGWRADLPKIYADLDVVVLTSRNEGFPVALIEALAAGRAVVASAVGGVPDLISDGRNGLLITSDEPADIARQVHRVISDPRLRRELGDAGRDTVYPRHDADALLGRIQGLYEELLTTP